MKTRNIMALSLSLLMGLGFEAQGAKEFDYDGDQRADFAVREAETFTQHIYSSASGPTPPVTFGRDAGDLPVSGDFDGDGMVDIAVRRASNQTWYIKNSSGIDTITGHADGVTRLRFGFQAGDIPVPADYDGDGVTDIAVRRPSNHTWYIRNSSGEDAITNHTDGITRRVFGKQAADIPVPADYDGDGKVDIAVRRPSNQTWYILNSSGVDTLTGKSDGITRRIFGRQRLDIPVPADYDGDGKADIAVRRPSNQTWYVLNSSGVDALTNNNDGVTRRIFGRQEADIPAVADYDGDGKADIAVRRPGTGYWYVLNTTGADDITNFSDGITRLVFPDSLAVTAINQSASQLWFSADIDGDGLNYTQEIAAGTDITNADTDGDGVNDGDEIVNGTDPTIVDAINSPPLFPVIEDFSMEENSTNVQILSATDADGDELTFTATSSSDYVQNSVAGNEWTITTSEVDEDTTAEILLIVSDGQQTDTHRVTVTIVDVPAENTPPRVAISRTSLRLNVSSFSNVRVDVTDEQGSVLERSVSIDDDTIAEVYMTDIGFEVLARARGDAVVSYTATDGEGLSTTAQMNLAVRDNDDDNDPPDFTLEGEEPDNIIRIPHNTESVINVLIDDPDSNSHFLSMTSFEPKIGTLDLIEGYFVNNDNKTLSITPKAIPRGNIDYMTFEMELNVLDDGDNQTTKIYELVVEKSDNAPPQFTFPDKLGAFINVNQNGMTEVSYQIADDDVENVQVTGIDYWYGDQTKFDVQLDADNNLFTVTTNDVEIGEAYGFVIQYVDISLVGHVNVELYVQSPFTEADQEMRDLKHKFIKADQALKEYVYIGSFYSQVLENLGHITQQQAEDFIQRLDANDATNNSYATFKLYLANIEFYIANGDFHDEGFKGSYITVINSLFEEAMTLGQSRFGIINEMAALSDGVLSDITFEQTVYEYDTQNNYYSRFVGVNQYGEWVDETWVFHEEFEFMNAILARMAENAESIISDEVEGE